MIQSAALSPTASYKKRSKSDMGALMYRDSNIQELQRLGKMSTDVFAAALQKGHDTDGRLDGRSSSPRCRKARPIKFSTDDIMRIAGARFIQSHSQVTDAPLLLHSPYEASFSDLSEDEIKNVELVELLLASAESLNDQQLERASRLLYQCNRLASSAGSPVERIVCYFGEALQERLHRSCGRTISKDLGKQLSVHLDHAITTSDPVISKLRERVPFSQVVQLCATQTIFEHVSGAKKIHVVDLQLGNGSRWTPLIQALSSRTGFPFELLKITAISINSEELYEKTGRRIKSVAESMHIPFSFKILKLSDMMELKEELFEVDPEEAMVIYSEYALKSLLVLPNRLESIMRVFKNLNPCLMVIVEVEANNNSPSFIKRFIEALFFYGALLDCFDECMEQGDPHKLIMESNFFRQGIMNIVVAEGEDRRTRHVKIDVWRAFFSRFNMIETQLKLSSWYQARLVLRNFPCRSSFTMDKNNKSLVFGWKGTPLFSVSAWKIRV